MLQETSKLYVNAVATEPDIRWIDRSHRPAASRQAANRQKIMAFKLNLDASSNHLLLNKVEIIKLWTEQHKSTDADDVTTTRCIDGLVPLLPKNPMNPT